MIAVLDENATSFANWLYQSLIEAYRRELRKIMVWHLQLLETVDGTAEAQAIYPLFFNTLHKKSLNP